MKNNILEYKGYHTKIEFDSESFLLRGKIEGINDFVDFECENIKDIEKEFHDAVDDYLEFCKEVGKKPEKEYKGTFNIRINPELHKKLAIVAMKNGDTLNASVEKAIQEYVLATHKENIHDTIKILAEALKTKSTYQYDKNTLYNDAKIIPFFNNVKMQYSEEMMN